jgi:hypothetical protein
MKDLLILLDHLLNTITSFPGHGGAKTIVADSLLMKHQIFTRVFRITSVLITIHSFCITNGK